VTSAGKLVPRFTAEVTWLAQRDGLASRDVVPKKSTMSPHNFDTLLKQHPELTPAIRSIQSWANSHPKHPDLDPRRLSRDLRDLDPVDLAMALFELVRVGAYTRVYMVATPQGDLIEGEWDDPNRVPHRLRDNFNVPFSLDDGELVPILKPAL
jgi:hypothetical protein